MAEAPPDLPLHTFRDPFVLRDGDGWRMLVGAGLDDGAACVLTYTSPTLTDWTYAGVLCQRVSSPDDPVWTGTAWECPQLVEVGGRHVLVVSVWADDQTHYVAAAVGDLTDGRFEAERWQRLTYGPGPLRRDGLRRRRRPALPDDVDPRSGWCRGGLGRRAEPADDHVPRGRPVGDPAPPGARVPPGCGGRTADAWDVEWDPTPGSSLTVADGHPDRRR